MIDVPMRDFCGSRLQPRHKRLGTIGASAPDEKGVNVAPRSSARHKNSTMPRIRNRSIYFCLLAFVAAALTTCTAPLFAQAPVQTTDRARTIGKQLMCTCGCGDTAGSCSHPGAAFSGPCEVAKAKLKEVDERISRGESDQSILQAFVQEYGEAALAAPPARGLNWFAYTFPAVAFAIGLGLVVMIIRVWHRPQVATASGPAVSPEMLEHVRRQIEHDVQQDD